MKSAAQSPDIQEAIIAERKLITEWFRETDRVLRDSTHQETILKLDLLLHLANRIERGEYKGHS